MENHDKKNMKHIHALSDYQPISMFALQTWQHLYCSINRHFVVRHPLQKLLVYL